MDMNTTRDAFVTALCKASLPPHYGLTILNQSGNRSIQILDTKCVAVSYGTTIIIIITITMITIGINQKLKLLAPAFLSQLDITVFVTQGTPRKEVTQECQARI